MKRAHDEEPAQEAAITAPKRARAEERERLVARLEEARLALEAFDAPRLTREHVEARAYTFLQRLVRVGRWRLCNPPFSGALATRGVSTDTGRALCRAAGLAAVDGARQ